MKTTIHCTSIDCPERKSVCCGKSGRTSTKAERAFGVPEFHCTGDGCGKEFVGGKCNHASTIKNKITPLTPQVYVTERAWHLIMNLSSITKDNPDILIEKAVKYYCEEFCQDALDNEQLKKQPISAVSVFDPKAVDIALKFDDGTHSICDKCGGTGLVNNSE